MYNNLRNRDATTRGDEPGRASPPSDDPAPRGARRLTIADLMALVAASGAGMFALQFAVGHRPGGVAVLLDLSTPPGGWSVSRAVYRASDLSGLALSVVGGWTVVLPLLRLRPPRPRRRRLSLQPGLTACLAAMVGMALGAALMAVLHALEAAAWGGTRSPFDNWLRYYLTRQLMALAGLSVASAWAVQALAGRWRPVPDAIDRLGRLTGAAWIVAGAVWASIPYAYDGLLR